MLSGKNASLLFTIAGAAAGEKLGRSVAGNFDMDGDGVPDFAAGWNVGNASYSGGALWGTTPGCNGKQHVQAVQLDPATGARRVVGSVPLSDCEEPTPGVYYRGAFWFVVGQTLYRITS